MFLDPHFIPSSHHLYNFIVLSSLMVQNKDILNKDIFFGNNMYIHNFSNMFLYFKKI